MGTLHQSKRRITDKEKVKKNRSPGQAAIQMAEEDTKKIRELYGGPVLNLQDGMMSIFIKPDASSQIIHFKNVVGLRTHSS